MSGIANQASADTTAQLNASQIVADMGAGWNLGNQLEANSNGYPSETAWAQPTVTQTLIDKVKSEGFKTIRIPASYLNCIGSGPNYTINPSWLNRIQEVVNYAHMYERFVVNGYPVVVGEYGAIHKSSHDSSNNRYRADYVRSIVATAKKYGAATIYWDNGHTGQYGFGLIDRRSYAVTQPGIIDAIMTGLGGGSPSAPPVSGATYKVRNSSTGAYLDSDQNGAVILATGSTYDDQDWVLTQTSSGAWTVRGAVQPGGWREQRRGVELRRRRRRCAVDHGGCLLWRVPPQQPERRQRVPVWDLDRWRAVEHRRDRRQHGLDLRTQVANETGRNRPPGAGADSRSVTAERSAAEFAILWRSSDSFLTSALRRGQRLVQGGRHEQVRIGRWTDAVGRERAAAEHDVLARR